MNKIILTLIAAAFILSSCGNTDKKAATENSKEVNTVSENGGTKYQTVDPSSQLLWRASHLVGVQKRFGKVNLKSAAVTVADNKLVAATVLIDMPSLVAENFDDAKQNAKLTGHLKSPDFFNVEKYPTAKFELTSIEPATGEFNSVVTGNLTIQDVTKSIQFNANVTVTDSYVQVKSEDFSVDRTDWNLTYNVEGSEGVPADYLIANEVGFTIDVKVLK